MNTGSRFQLQRIANLLLFSISVVPVLLFLYIVVQRIALPIDLEWGEGAGINQIQRILSGRALYIEPNLDFSPLVYTPLYYFISAAVAKVVEPVYLAARLVSVISTAASAFLLFWLVRRRTDEPMAGWLSAAFYIACFSLCGGYFDLVRVDALYAFIALAGFVVFLKGNSATHYTAAGLLIVMGFFIKQSAVIVFLPIVFYLLIRDWKKAWILLPVMLIGILAPIAVANLLTENWFGYYIFTLPREHGFSILSAVKFWTGDLMRYLGIALGFSAAFWIFRNAQNTQKEEAAELDTRSARISVNGVHEDEGPLIALFALGAVLGSWVTRSSNGGGANNLMLAYAAVALLFGLGVDRTLQRTQAWREDGTKINLLLTLLIAIQFLGLYYNPFDYIPTADEVAANERLIERIEQSDRAVLIPYRSDLPARAGKQTSIHAVNLFELTGYFLGEVQPAGRDIVRKIQLDICAQEFSLVVLDQAMPWFQTQVDFAYTQESIPLMPSPGRRSLQLLWQEGYEQVFLPKESYSLDLCLESINQPEK